MKIISGIISSPVFSASATSEENQPVNFNFNRLDGIDDVMKRIFPHSLTRISLTDHTIQQIGGRDSRYGYNVRTFLSSFVEVYKQLKVDLGIRSTSFNVREIANQGYSGHSEVPPLIFRKYDPHVMQLERRITRMGHHIETMRANWLVLECPKTHSERKIWGAMSGLHDEMKELFALYEAAKPSLGVQKELTDAANQMKQQADAVHKAQLQTQTLLEKIEKRHAETEAMLAEVRSSQAQNQEIADSLSKKFESAMAYNQEVSENLKTMFSTFLEAKDSFMNKPTQTTASDSNVSEMLRLLTQLVNDDGKG